MKDYIFTALKANLYSLLLLVPVYTFSDASIANEGFTKILLSNGINLDNILSTKINSFYGNFLKTLFSSKLANIMNMNFGPITPLLKLIQKIVTLMVTFPLTKIQSMKPQASNGIIEKLFLNSFYSIVIILPIVLYKIFTSGLIGIVNAPLYLLITNLLIMIPPDIVAFIITVLLIFSPIIAIIFLLTSLVFGLNASMMAIVKKQINKGSLRNKQIAIMTTLIISFASNYMNSKIIQNQQTPKLNNTTSTVITPINNKIETRFYWCNVMNLALSYLYMYDMKYNSVKNAAILLLGLFISLEGSTKLDTASKLNNLTSAISTFYVANGLNKMKA